MAEHPLLSKQAELHLRKYVLAKYRASFNLLKLVLKMIWAQMWCSKANQLRLTPHTARCFYVKYSTWGKINAWYDWYNFCPKKNKNPYNQQWLLCWTLQETKPVLETTEWPTTEECVWVCIIQHLHDKPKINSHSRNFILVNTVSTPRLKASHESKTDLSPYSLDSQITLPKPSYAPIWLSSK